MENNDSWIKVINPDLNGRLGHIRHALFDFDGTISVLRQGWEGVMIPVCLRAICGDGPVPAEIEQEVIEYVDRSTGILTILQMEWLAEAVRRHGRVPNPLSAAEYKAIYLRELMRSISHRIDAVAAGQAPAEAHMLAGASDFLAGLQQRGVRLYAASGTDHADVVREAGVLGVAKYFEGRIYGALDAREAHSKEVIIQRILNDNSLAGHELLVAGDGPVEIRAGRERGALTLGVASDEVKRKGWNAHKIKRLEAAGADLMVADFEPAERLLGYLFGER